MRTGDSDIRYGWISIALHWITAAIILVMWIIGTMSQANWRPNPSLVPLHTSIGMTAYLLLWLRIFWRFKAGHPGPLPKQASVSFVIAKYFHYLLLIVVGSMLISGPLMVWSAGDHIHVFSYTVASPFPAFPDRQKMLSTIHGICGTFVLLAMIAHITAVLKRAFWNRDGTLEKILVPGRRP